MDQPLPDDLHSKFLSPLIFGLTTLTFGEALLEVLTRGGMSSPDPLQEIYLTLMGGYMAGIEVQKWTQKYPADPADDPLVERVNRSGWIMALWWMLFVGVHLWRYSDASVPMPELVKPVTMGITLLFIGKRVSRRVRHTRRGVGGMGQEESSDALTFEEPATASLLAFLAGHAEGLTLREIESGLPQSSRASLVRAVRDLLAAQRLQRIGTPRSPNARYRLP